VWGFYDEKKMFDEWQGVLRKLYMSAAALVAGWVSFMPNPKLGQWLA
jgi:hypothetical protein